ncbi:MAG: hypothetical protein EZS28_023589 [Streblomastix strix]|uniref:Uncharacterized protein n=1 Tax=Streblomastix strix TaxID=222440 RepID=A0A5J4VEM6_9EUKA|nr:MAG: hypothetical protein EZS28_023589 [Streblomastix strix]
MLQTLFAAYNNITFCPPLIGFKSELRVNLSFNLLESMPQLGSDVESFAADRNKITRIDKELPKNSKLTILSLRLNKLENVPQGISNLPLLTMLLLGGNQIKTISSEIGMLTSLRTLDLSLNMLDHVPGCLQYLRELNKLSLAFNRIKHIPAWLFILPLLKILILSGNRIEELPTEEEVGSAMLQAQNAGNTESKTLNANQQQQQNKGNQNNCKSSQGQNLIINQNQNQNYIQNQQKSNSQSKIPQTRSSTFMDSNFAPQTDSNHKITPSLAESGNIQASPLVHVALSSNRLTQFPSVLLRFTSLAQLFMAHNAISEVPIKLFHLLPQIVRLDLSFNKIRDISQIEMPMHIRAVFFDFSHNRISQLPERVEKMELRMRSLDIKENEEIQAAKEQMEKQ